MAKERRAGSLGFAEAILIIYNKRLKKALPWNDLYKNKAEKKRSKSMPAAEASQDAPAASNDLEASVPDNETST